MFRIDRNNLPVVLTRKALLVLDLQNDLVSPGGLISVEEPPNFVEDAINLAVHFRQSGNDVIWVRSEFAGSRPVNSDNRRSESIITDRELAQVRRAAEGEAGPRSTSSQRLVDMYSKMIDKDDGEDLDQLSVLQLDSDRWEGPNDETFLTIEENQSARFVLPGSAGADFAPIVRQNIDNTRDLIFLKSYYSAFKDGTLVQTLRAKFVTEIYLCGALTNISVFATAMDAARHGYNITIVEDCLGYRSRARHDAALSKLTELTGCDILNSTDVLENLVPPAVKAPQLSQLRTSQRPLQSYDYLKSRRMNTVPSSENFHSQAQTRNDHTDIAEPKLVAPATKARDKVKTKIKARRRPSRSPSQRARKIRDIIPASEDTAEPHAVAKKTSPGSRPSHKLTTQPDLYNLTTEKSEGLLHQDDRPRKEESAPLCEGDTTVISNLLDIDASSDIFERVRDEVLWQKMSHRGGDVPRLISVQGEVAEDGSLPIYRHPADESPALLPFSPTVTEIRAEVEKVLGHSVNHVLIQFYRDGNDYISEHSDKTLDIVPNTFIANVSLGALRTMVFRTKKDAQNKDNPDAADTPSPRKAHRAPLPHNSMCKMGLVTNMRWLHGIRQDKRMMSERSEAELAYSGGRISLTFRLIGTFISKDEQRIWGQGATGKTKDCAKSVINGETPEAESMVRAFGRENHSSEFDWGNTYGNGFDVLHMSNLPKLFLSGDLTVDLGVQMMLSEYGIEWAEGNQSPTFRWNDYLSSPDPVPESRAMRYIDNDAGKSTVEGDMAVLLYIDTVYGPSAPRSNGDFARLYTRVQKAGNLLRAWRGMPHTIDKVEEVLASWEHLAGDDAFLAGPTLTAIDFALAPIFIELKKAWPVNPRFVHLDDYVVRMIERDSVKKIIGSLSHLKEQNTQSAKEGNTQSADESISRNHDNHWW